MPQQSIFHSRIQQFAKLLDIVDGGNDNISNYSRRYLQYLLRHRVYFLHIYASVLQHALLKSEKAFTEVALIDYGAGNGLLGLFAKYCGCKKVFLCDTDKNFVEAAKVIAQRAGIMPDGFVHGDINEFRKHYSEEHIDWIVGTDVIEHIYDLEVFFDTVQSMNAGMITVFTTASNPDNYFKVKKLRAMQVNDELKGGHPSDFELAGEEPHPPYLQMRKDIIDQLAPSLSPGEILQLAHITRGKNKADIGKAILEYKATGKLPDAPADAWNTCHPLTGSWSERILPVAAYSEIYKRHQFCAEAANGFYDAYSKTSKRFFNSFRNLLMKIMGKKMAPFITLVGFPNRGNTDIC